MKSPSLFKKVIAPFLTFALMFIGAGFISGSIVHLGEGANPWDISILTTGVALFMIGSYVQEILYNGKSLKEEGTLPFLFFSLLLSLGIGMVSGGTQHFVDTPVYSSYLIPIGLAVGILAFVLKTNIKLAGAEAAKLLLGTLLFCIILWGALSYGGKAIPIDMQAGDHHGTTTTVSTPHAMTVRSDQEFISGMIPHHQEAVDSSRVMLTRVTQPEQRAFLEKIISIQTKEIEMLKQWHQNFFGTPYTTGGSYMPMMPKLENIKGDAEAWHSYLEGMIGHHEGAVNMAKEILSITTRQEVRAFAQEVIDTQSQEIQQMNNWLAQTSPSAKSDKIYVAIEGESTIAVIDRESRTVAKRIPLNSNGVSYMPHNVEVAPDGKSVWVTANAMSSDMQHSFLPVARASEGHTEQDQIIIIDPSKDVIQRRINLGTDLHLAHVAVTPDSSKAIVAAQTKGIIFSINTKTFEVEKQIAASKGSEPHGLRITPSGKEAYIALLQGKGVGVYNIDNGTYREEKLQGASVQTAITPDGKYVAVSQYDTKQIALLDIQKATWEYVALPAGAKGPVQLYSTPDSKFIYVADQGHYFGQPDSNQVYKLSLHDKTISTSIAAGSAPHGVTVSQDGKEVYITNLVSNDVSVIDTATDKEIARIPVGKEPNGISVWTLK